MTKQTLCDYQVRCHEAVFDAMVDGYKSILYTVCTGGGKTTIMAEIVDTFLKHYEWKVLAAVHRREIVQQIYDRVRLHCDLKKAWDIGVEMADYKAINTCKVIVGNISTLRNPKRLPAGWEPNVIIYDEAHRAAASSYVSLRERFPDAVVIGCTATPKRTDKKCLYSIDIAGNPVKVAERAGSKAREVKEGEAIFEKLCFEYSLLDAINDGWVVPFRGYEVLTDVDISGVETSGDDFNQKQLLGVIEDNDAVMLDRIDRVIGLWQQVCPERQTIVFCPGVKTAKWAADHWREAGYTAADLNGETDNMTRARTIEDFLMGKIQVLTNCDVFSEGTDLPPVSCIAHLAPTKSWVRYNQRSGRGGRSMIAAKLRTLATAEERTQAIADSVKPDCIILDAVDICKNGTLCTVPAILDIPCTIDLEGESVTEAKKMLDEFEEVKEQAIGEAPRTFRQLAGRLQEIKLLTESGAKTRAKWQVREDGNYSFGKAAPGYSATLSKEGNQWRLQVRYGKEELLNRIGRSDFDPRDYFDKAAERAADTIEQHRKAHPKGKGTLEWLSTWKNNSGGWAVRDLTAAGFTMEQIDALSRKQVWPTLQSVREKKKREREMQYA